MSLFTESPIQSCEKLKEQKEKYSGAEDERDQVMLEGAHLISFHICSVKFDCLFYC